MLATIKSGPSGARSGSQTYSPDFRVTVSGNSDALGKALGKHKTPLENEQGGDDSNQGREQTLHGNYCAVHHCA
jgi:hypothetical protein